MHLQPLLGGQRLRVGLDLVQPGDALDGLAGQLDCEVTTATIAGQDYDRGDESEQEFIARLTELARELRRTCGGSVRVICGTNDLAL